MATDVVSGLFGAINNQVGVENWQYTKTYANVSRVDSSTAGGTARGKGPFDAKGSFVSNSFETIWFPGTSHAFTGLLGSTTYGAAGKTRAGTIRIDSLSIAINPESGAHTTLSYGFSFVGDITKGTGTVVDDGRTELPHNPLAEAVTSTLNAKTLDHIRNMTLNFTSATQSYVDSDTGGGQGRGKGPIDWTASIVRTGIDEAIADDEAGVLVITLGSLGTIELDAARVEGIGPIQCNPDTGNVIASTLNLAMHGQGSDGGLGSIDILGTNYWPPTAP